MTKRIAWNSCYHITEKKYFNNYNRSLQEWIISGIETKNFNELKILLKHYRDNLNYFNKLNKKPVYPVIYTL